MLKILALMLVVDTLTRQDEDKASEIRISVQKRRLTFKLYLNLNLRLIETCYISIGRLSHSITLRIDQRTSFCLANATTEQTEQREKNPTSTTKFRLTSDGVFSSN